MGKKEALVIFAHAADFCTRAGETLLKLKATALRCMYLRFPAANGANRPGIGKAIRQEL